MHVLIHVLYAICATAACLTYSSLPVDILAAASLCTCSAAGTIINSSLADLFQHNQIH